jgi:F420-0:gamma-glutamyl ligase
MTEKHKAAEGQVSMADEDEVAISARLAELFARAGLDVGDADREKVAALVKENEASARRLREGLERYSEPAFGLPSRRRGGE